MKVEIDYYMRIDVEPKWSRQQWWDFIESGNIVVNRPYPEYCLVNIPELVHRFPSSWSF